MRLASGPFQAAASLLLFGGAAIIACSAVLAGLSLGGIVAAVWPLSLVIGGVGALLFGYIFLWLDGRLTTGGNPPNGGWDYGGGTGGDGGVGGPIPWPGAPPPGHSERGPRQRGPHAEAAAYAVPEGDR